MDPGKSARRQAQAYLLLVAALVASAAYLYATPSPAPGSWVLAVVLAAAVLGASVILARTHPILLLNLLSFVSLSTVVVAGVVWWSTRNGTAGLAALCALPPAVLLSAWSVSRSKPRRSRSPGG